MKESNSVDYEKLVNSHLTEAKRKLKRAKDLYEDCYYDEAAHDGYYSMLHAAKALLALKKVQVKTHRGVISEIQKLYVKSGIITQDLASALSRDLQIRMRVDYDIMIEISDDLANDVINDAEEFLKEVDKIIAKSKLK
ncbi:MAG: hypothetical protein A7316_06445 [Candidatus Altiarchaeales archaeon WOR_SM1_86-2]|nr:MAG: hypothetical protein A7316_06445 [Candidatus Altiarchaeales archaeon WOR_SM1_86-2]ODS39620.1 MAG: hypothetical protein A7315_10765 [Candidatus Altiarchaeales archaeon WOR_SM1_79]